MIEKWNKIEWDAFFGDALLALIILVSAFLIWLALSRALNALDRHSRLSPSQILPIRLVLRYVVVLIALLLVLSVFGIAVGNFWTFVSTVVGLVAIGFVAVWSVLSNISSTFLILLIQPFKIGDYVRLVGDDVMGRVVDVNFMFTSVRKGNGDLFRVPNNQFFQKSILRPADPEALERASEDGGDSAKESEHKDQNLEGIRFPEGAAGEPKPAR